MKYLRVFLPLLLAAAILSGCGANDSAASGGSVAERIDSAWQNYRLNEWSLALRDFESAIADTEPGGGDWAMCQYGIATTWAQRRPGEDPKKAREMYQELLAKAPQSAMAPWTELALARMIHLVPVGQDPDYPEVRKLYKAIEDKYPGHLAAKEAFMYRMSTLIASLDDDLMEEAAAELEKFVQGESQEFVGSSYSLLSVVYNMTGQQEKRLWAEENAFDKTEVDPADPSVEFAWAYWNLACISEFELGDFARARKYYNELMEKYPSDIRIHGCKSALKRMDDIEARIREDIRLGRPTARPETEKADADKPEA
jgi:tetratricopeptide (TPR) repeat protein